MRPVFTFNQMSPYNGTHFARIMVESIRRHMPDAVIFQLSDRDADEVGGVDQVIKSEFGYDKNTYPIIWFYLLCAVFGSIKGFADTIISCDADTIFGGDVSHLLEDDFQIAICKRPKDCSEDETSAQYRIIHPYNSGFFIVRGMDVSECCRDVISMNMFNKNYWAIGQHIIGLVVNSGAFKVKFLDSRIYNRLPKSEEDFDELVRVWHFKGNRKDWMTGWSERHGDRAA